jgi:glutamate-1-semialdehyde 2,1-aminomutase
MATNPGPKRPRSSSLFERASALFPGGVNSPVRAFKSVGGTPVFLERGVGPFVHDVDGNRYIDFVGSWGALILGHADPDVVAAVIHAASAGTTFGAPTPREVELGELIRFMMPSLEKMRFVSSGTEATMSALRAARGFTGRHRIIKVDGGYHGHADALLAKAGSGVVSLGLPGSSGVTPAAVADTLVVPYNDLDAMRAAFEEHRDEIAALIIEPIPANMGIVMPRPAYLPLLRSLCDEHGTLLIFDEVITGFRVARGGAQQMFGVRPDLTCLGKVVGGGLPFGVYGGRADVMDVIAPVGPVYQAGTLSGNPVAVAAGLATLKRLDEHAYVALEGIGRVLEDDLARAVRRTGVTGRVQRVGSAFTLFFAPEEVVDLSSAKLSNTDHYAKFFHGMLERGFLLPPAQFEAAFISLAHTLDEVNAFTAAARETLTEIAAAR